MRFLLYVPGPAKGKTPQDELTRVGLGEIAAQVDTGDTPTGPDGKGGLLFGWLDSIQNRFGFLPDQQTWIPSAASGDRATGAYWVGLWNEDAPTEEDLRRPDHRAGSWVTLGDGGKWLVPTLGTLDRHPRLQPDGSLQWCIDEAFNWLVTDLEKREATGVTRTTQNGQEVRSFIYDDEKDFWFLCRLLQINYRLTPEVVSHLGLLTRVTIRAMVATMMDMVLVEDDAA